jgi:hypothetical protein
MNKLKLIGALFFYMHEHERLVEEYHRIKRIPIYHFLMSNHNINKRIKLNKWYEDNYLKLFQKGGNSDK